VTGASTRRLLAALGLALLLIAARGAGSARAACGEEGGDEIAFQGSGKLLFAACGKGRQAVIRLDAGGRLDPSFAGDGSLGPWTSRSAAHLAVTPEGKVLVQMSLGKGKARRVVLRRFFADGRLDRSFAAGNATVLRGGTPEGIRVFAQPGGTAVLAYYGEDDGCYGNDCAERNNYLQLVRYSATGRRIAEASYYTEDWSLRDIAMAPEGDLLVVGRSAEYGKATYLRTKPNLKPRAKHSFPDGPFEPGIAAVLPGPGASFFGSSGFGPAQRFLPDWSTDGSFGEAGFANCGPAEASVTPRAGLPSGGFLATGGDPSCGLAEFDARGRLDPAFGSGGSVDLVALGLLPPPYRLQSLATGPEGQIATVSANPDKPVVRISRLTADGQLETGFGANGVETVDGVRPR
jgi:hypothetical protein